MTLFTDIRDPDQLLSGRLDLWSQGIKPIQENSAFGVGYGQSIFTTDAAKERYELLKHDADRSVDPASLSSRERSDRRQSNLHSLYLQTLAEVGIIGSLAYLWLTVVVAAAGWRAVVREWRDPRLLGVSVSFAGFVSFMIAGLIYYLNQEHLAHITFAVCGLMLAAGSDSKTNAMESAAP